MLDSGIKNEWIHRLRSGEYKKCRGKLRGKDGERCAIGILCDILGAKWEYDRSERKYRPRVNGLLVDNNVPGVALDYPILDRIGMTMIEHDDIANLNDGVKGIASRCTFAEIADHVEREL